MMKTDTKILSTPFRILRRADIDDDSAVNQRQLMENSLDKSVRRKSVRATSNATTEETVDFGFQTVERKAKAGLVRGVFDSVATRYDIMNDVMSAGVHRLWKAAMIDWMAPQPNQHLVDLAGGTGDISLRFIKAGGGSACITDINKAMLQTGQQRVQLQRHAAKLSWCVGNAESLPLANKTADFVTIAFGLRNITDRPAAIAEAYRILKPGGRFLCLEFSHIQNRPLAKVYDAFSFNLLPVMGQVIAGDAASYRYLVESIRQ